MSIVVPFGPQHPVLPEPLQLRAPRTGTSGGTERFSAGYVPDRTYLRNLFLHSQHHLLHGTGGNDGH